MSDNNPQWPWSELDLDAAPDDPRDIRRAYAAKLKKIEAATDVEAFEKLRQAYDYARRRVSDHPSGNKASKGHQIAVDVIKQLNPVVDHQSKYNDKDIEKKKNSFEIQTQETSNPVNPWQRPDLSDPDILMKKTSTLVSQGSLRASDWQVLLDAPALSDPQISTRFQWELVTFLNEKIVSGGFGAANRWELYTAIDERFGWVSDGIGFVRKYPQARGLQSTMTKVVRENQWKQKTAPKTRSTKTEVLVKPLHPIMWIAPLIIWLFLLGV